jgi:pimeloyl-ACP methyl ester carboxylesterase
VLEFASGPTPLGRRAQLEVSRRVGDRRAAYRDIRCPLLVVGFADDLVIPTHLCREVAEAVPGARYAEVPHTGHYGYLEQPEAVNRLLLDFLAAVPANKRRAE